MALTTAILSCISPNEIVVRAAVVLLQYGPHPFKGSFISKDPGKRAKSVDFMEMMREMSQNLRLKWVKYPKNWSKKSSSESSCLKKL